MLIEESTVYIEAEATILSPVNPTQLCYIVLEQTRDATAKQKIRQMSFISFVHLTLAFSLGR